MRRLVLALLVIVAILALAACQSAPLVAPQHGNDAGALSGGVSPSAPVDQHGSPIFVFVGSGNSNAGGQGAAAAAASDLAEVLAALTKGQSAIGHQANGDVKGSGRQDGGAQSSTQTSTQTSTPTQTVDAGGLAKEAADLLAGATPGSEVATLAAGALDAAKRGDTAKASDLLAKAKAAKKAAGAGTTPPAPPAPPTGGGN